jgi:hypothetical protein
LEGTVFRHNNTNENPSLSRTARDEDDFNYIFNCKGVTIGKSKMARLADLSFLSNVVPSR